MYHLQASSGVSNNHQTTKFAFPITTGMAFNRTLWQLTGRQIGHEARALMNAGKGLSTFWAPVINLAREPRWGRNIEGGSCVRMRSHARSLVLVEIFACSVFTSAYPVCHTRIH